MTTMSVPVQRFARPELVIPAHDPRREIRMGTAILSLFLIGFVGWAGIAHLDAAVHSPGVIRVAGNRQAVQSLAGGVISAIHVREGEQVRAGQLLVEFASIDALAQERSLASRVFGLQAEIARINTERLGGTRIERPLEWSPLTGDDRAEADRALASEQANLASQYALVQSQRAVLHQRIAEVGNQIDGYRQRQQSNQRQGTLNEDELDSVQQLYRKGFATKTRVLALQRSRAAIDGEIGATEAEMARLRSTSGETRLQMVQLAEERQQQNADRLRTAETELQTVLPQWKAARDQLELTRLRAPVTGAVIGLAINTVGGVAAPGQRLMEIVPTRGTLEIEAQVAPGDANDLHAGQAANVRITSLLGRNLPVLHGTLRRVSADSLVDDRTGRAYYTAAISVPRAQLDAIGRDAGIEGSIKPGTPVDVSVPVQPRTALAYWLGPLAARFSTSFSER